MRYDETDRESDNIEDRRGQGGGFRFPFPGGGQRVQIPMPGGRGGGISLTTLLIIGGLMLLFGINPLDLLTGGGGSDYSNVPQMPRMDVPQRPQRQGYDIPGLPGHPAPGGQAQSDKIKQFMARVLADTEDVWTQVFQNAGKRYQAPQLVLFSGDTETRCGQGVSQMGPFYCPLDRKVYLDTSFFDELSRRFGSPGQFAQAYVLAHEVGHHVQALLGIADQVEAAKRRARSQQEVNQIQVRMELQADCFAGVWASLNDQLKKRLEPGDVDQGLRAASAIGDDMIQRQTSGRVVPDAFTHGSSAQRVYWFRKGLESGQPNSCDTFNQPI